MKYIFDEIIERMKKEIERLFGITEEDLAYRRLNIEIKKPTRPEQIIIKNTYRKDGCYGIPDGKKHVTFYFCNKDFTTIKDEDTIHVQIIDEHAYYDESGNLLTGYDEDEDYSSNSNGDYLVEIYPLIV